jgi:hypothetical protein
VVLKIVAGNLVLPGATGKAEGYGIGRYDRSKERFISNGVVYEREAEAQEALTALNKLR